jgi:hypothetical protein
MDGTMSPRLRVFGNEVFLVRPACEVLPLSGESTPALRTNSWYIPVGSVIAPVMKSVGGEREAFVATPALLDAYDKSVIREVRVAARPGGGDWSPVGPSPRSIFLKAAELSGMTPLAAMDAWCFGRSARVPKETRRAFDAFLLRHNVTVTSAANAAFSRLLAAILTEGGAPIDVLEAAVAGGAAGQ